MPKLNFQLPKYQLYLAPTSQSSWSKRPFHVSLSSSLWTDLLLVAILFRLNEFTLSHLTPGIQGMWLPICIFFAVYDVWETRVLFDSVFKFQDDLFHHFIGIVQWLLLAVMATAITPDRVWSDFDCMLFSALKLAHQSVRVFNYFETWAYSHSKRARRSARARCIVYLVAWPLNLAAPLLLRTQNQDLACGMWFVAFFVQRVLWSLLKWDPVPNPYVPFRSDAAAIKVNIPFKVSRYGDWTMLQLGAIILGFMTVPVANTTAAYGTLVFGYVYVGCLNMLSYSINPQDPSAHALVLGTAQEFIWLELFSLGGLCLLGIAAAMRVHLFYPEQVVLEEFRHYSWVLGVCAQVSAMVMFAQELCHGGQSARNNKGWIVWIKLAAAGIYLVSAVAYVQSDSQQPEFLIMGMALTSILVLTIQVANGAFKRRVFKNERLKLLGHFRAAVIGIVLLTRARRNILRNGTGTISQKTIGTSVIIDEQPTVFEQQQLAARASQAAAPPRRASQIAHRTTLSQVAVEDGNVVKPSAQQLAAQSAKLRPSRRASQKAFHHHRDASSTGNLPKTQFSTSSVDDSKISGMLPLTKLSMMSREMNRASLGGIRQINNAKQEIRQWKIVLNDKFYSPPHVFVEGNKATKYKVQWSDLFFDVLFVGVVFRLGDLLLSGMGAGYSETSVHYLHNVLNSNTTLYYDPVYDPARQDAVGVFATVFLAVWGMWQNRLAYSSKVGTGDVLHKIMDLSQGLAVMLIAVNITTQIRMQDETSGNAYAVAGGLAAFQVSMVLLWVELYLSPDSKTNMRARGTATRNIQRDLVSLVPLLLSFATIYHQVTLIATTTLWALSWLLPFLMRIFVLKVVNDHNAVRDLHRYVIHRLGDAALILLGEGVLQIIRAKVLVKNLYFFAAVMLGLFGVTAVRIAVWSMDCFTDSNKHGQLLSLNAGIALYFVRSVAGPALVAMGVAMKKMVSMSYANEFEESNRAYYWLLCGASFIGCITHVCTYELHRFAGTQKFRRIEPALMLMISLLFLVWPAVPLGSWVTELLCLCTWMPIILLHFLLDDYFLLKHRVDRGETEAGPLLRQGSMKSVKSTLRKRGLLHTLSGGIFERGRSGVFRGTTSARPKFATTAQQPSFMRSSRVTLDRAPPVEKKFYSLVMHDDSSRTVQFNFDSSTVPDTVNPAYVTRSPEEEEEKNIVHFAKPTLQSQDSVVIVPEEPFFPRLDAHARD